ncbi:MAG: hypothetical protein NC344_02490 [Bacteroidales bacterium]|nr:hypothetical protein [Bacteroidales bacterium]MCM1146700.1 hypothetical protein [Bacteroidales bacterium]MCM1205517.1 hypothetical protein [Bacillota bacterium]MCM1509222.1 hypothetical protein [Clostridium sp.]
MENKTEQQAQSAESLTKTEAFVVKYKKVIGISVVALLVVVAGVILLNTFYIQPRQDEASTAMAKAQDLFAQEQYEKALNGDGVNLGFLKIADQYGCTDAGNLANLYAGLCYANLGKAQEAEKFLSEFSTADDAMVSPAAVAALGNVYAKLNKIDDAVSALKKAAKMADSESETGNNQSLSPQFLLQAGELLESQGKKSEALEIYKRIKADYVNSAVYREIDKYIERCAE